jgi:hypothetical protein
MEPRWISGDLEYACPRLHVGENDHVPRVPRYHLIAAREFDFGEQTEVGEL